jgi:lipopolysaccharide export system permease protein
MSILSRYAFKEVLSHLGGVLAIILGIFLVQRFASLLADAIEGSLPIGAIFHLLAMRTIMALPSLVPVTFYLAVLLGLGRLHQDREITGLASCGVPPARMHRAVITLAAFAAVVNGVLSFSVRPWAAARFQRVRHAAMADSKIEDMRPRRFYTVEQDGEAVIFADTRSESDAGVLENVFVQMRDGRQLSVFTAKAAVEQRDETHGVRFLRLFDGYRYDIDVRGDERQITAYQELSLRAPLGGSTVLPEREETRSAAALARSTDPKDAGELQWRIANAVSVLLLAILAVPLSPTTPRQGKYAKLLVAVLLYVAYRNLLGAARHWMEDGILPFFPGLWIVHALLLLVALALFAVAPGRRARWTRGGRRAKAAA